MEFVGACDLDAKSRERFASRWQRPAFASLDELFSAARPDAVHLLTPPSTHTPLALELLRRGVHVLVEKPFAFTTADADRMIAAAHAAGRVVTANHNRWFDPVVGRARRLVESGELGELVGVEVFQGAAVAEVSSAEGEASHWTTNLPGGYLYDLVPHPSYLLTGFIGAVREVLVQTRRGPGGRLEELRAVVDGERALGTLTLSLQARPFTNTVVLRGTRLMAEVNLNNMTLVVRRVHKVPKVVGKVLPNLDEAWQLLSATVRNGVDFVTGRQRYYPGMGVHFSELYGALARGQTAPVSMADSRAPVELIERLWSLAGFPLSGVGDGGAGA